MSLKTHDYGEYDYWEKRYSEKEFLFEWYFGYKEMRDLLAKRIDKSKVKNTMLVGIGNSVFGEEMVEDQWPGVIVAVDYAKSVIQQMRARAEEKNISDKLIYQEMDCRKMTFPNESFDVVIDKGTMDAICCGHAYKENIAAMEREISRVLVPGGVYIVFSYGKPVTRLEYMNHPEYNWDVSAELFINPHSSPPGNEYFIYTMIKHSKK
jgi:ubiquinone/menaquinone biosynthesis C-methylase UbiE